MEIGYKVCNEYYTKRKNKYYLYCIITSRKHSDNNQRAQLIMTSLHVLLLAGTRECILKDLHEKEKVWVLFDKYVDAQLSKARLRGQLLRVCFCCFLRHHALNVLVIYLDFWNMYILSSLKGDIDPGFDIHFRSMPRRYTMTLFVV